MEMRSPGDHRKAHWVELCDELLALTVDDGAEIRRLGVDRPRDEIATMFGISVTTVAALLTRPESNV
jgi:DNA-directed RNA polymerase specialized sigma24 family protein